MELKTMAMGDGRAPHWLSRLREKETIKCSQRQAMCPAKRKKRLKGSQNEQRANCPSRAKPKASPAFNSRNVYSVYYYISLLCPPSSSPDFLHTLCLWYLRCCKLSSASRAKLQHSVAQCTLQIDKKWFIARQTCSLKLLSSFCEIEMKMPKALSKQSISVKGTIFTQIREVGLSIVAHYIDSSMEQNLSWFDFDYFKMGFSVSNST